MNAVLLNQPNPSVIHFHDVYELMAVLSDTLDNQLITECDEVSLELNELNGNGAISLHSFKNGISLLEIKGILKRDIKINFLHTNDPFNLIYCLDGKINYQIGALKKGILNKSEMLVCSNKNKNSLLMHFLADSMINLNLIIIDRSEFIRDSSCYLETTDIKLKTLFSTNKGELAYLVKKNIDLNILSTFYKNELVDFTGLAKRVNVEGKVNEILSFELRNFFAAENRNTNKIKLRPSEIEKIKLAALLLDEELTNPKSVEQLAKQVGLSLTKLQFGFKSVFNLTVNNYLKKIRLEYAKEQLLIGEMNISEIIYSVGLVNKSYFTRMFKKAYGTTPTLYSNHEKH